MEKKFSVLVISVLLCFGALSARAAESDVRKAEELMRQGKSAEAYGILAPLEFEGAGNVDFDYLIGIAALDSGKPDRAVVAFERVLAVNPAHMGARLDMGRAFFALGSTDLAKQEFERVLLANPPEAARKVVEQYLGAIEKHAQAARRRLTGFVEVGVGFDDNITSVTSNFQGGSQQAFGGTFNPTGNAIERDAGFFMVGGGVDYANALTDTLIFTAGADFKGRYMNSESAPTEPPRVVPGDTPSDNSAFDSETLSGRIGLSLQMARHVFGVNLQRQEFRQDGDTPINPGEKRRKADRDTDAVGVEWRYSLTPEAQIGVFAQYANNRYLSNKTQDTNQTLVGLSYVHTFQRAGNPLIFVSVYQSRDDALRPQNPPANTTDVSKTVKGLRLFGQYSVKESTDVYAGASYSRREDDTALSRSTIVAFGKDDTYEFTLGAAWRFAPLWSVRGQVQYTDNDSNLKLYSFDRTETMVVLRRDFR